MLLLEPAVTLLAYWIGLTGAGVLVCCWFCVLYGDWMDEASPSADRSSVDG